MEIVYKGMKGNNAGKVKRAAIFAFVAVLGIFAVIMTLSRALEDIQLYISIVVIAAIGVIGAYTELAWNCTYKITDEGLLITRPILHRRLFAYGEINEVMKTTAEEIRASMSERWNEIHSNDIAETTIATPLGNVKARYNTASTREKTFEDMKLNMFANYSSLPVRLSQSRTSKVSPWKLHLEVPEYEYVLISVKDDYLGDMEYVLSPERADEFISKLKERIGK